MDSVTHLPDSATEPRAGVPLDYGTQLVEPPLDGFALAVYPDCGEATAAFVSRAGRPDPEVLAAQRLEDEAVADIGEGSEWSKLAADARKALNVARATARARGRLRRYAVQNQLTYLHTLTYRCLACDGDPCTCGGKVGPDSRARVKRDVATFMRSLRDHLGGQPIPYAYVIERGKKSTQRLHVHVLLPRHLEETKATGPAPIMAELWGWGRVDLRFRGGAVEGARARAKACARYLSKYLAKSLADDDDAWSHSYERSQGFNVRVVTRSRLSYSDALTLAAWMLEGQGELYLSDSDDWTDYEGPPAFFMSAG